MVLVKKKKIGKNRQIHDPDSKGESQSDKRLEIIKQYIYIYQAMGKSEKGYKVLAEVEPACQRLNSVTADEFSY